MAVDDRVRDRQSRVAKSGSDWEIFVKNYLNRKLADTGIEVIVGKFPEVIRRRSENLFKQLAVPAKSSSIEEATWADIDLLAVNGETAVTVISCKTSLHGRFTETLFWSLLFRTLTRIDVVLVTPDAGSGPPEKLHSEWGTPEHPSKDRILAESYLAGVYVKNDPEFTKIKTPTAIGGIVRPLSELPDDIQRHSDRISKFTSFRGRREGVLE